MIRTFGLRAALIFLVLIAIAPVFGVVVQASLVERAARIERAEASLRALVELGAVQQERFIEGARQMLAAMSFAPPVYENDLGACVAYMHRLQRHYPSGYGSFGLIDDKGHLTCRAVLPNPPVNSSDRLFYRTSVQTGRFSVGEFVISRASGRPVLTFGLPVYRDEARKQLRGVVYLALDVTQADEDLRRLALTPDTTLMVSDANGTVIAAAGARAVRIGATLPDEFLRRAITRERPQFAREQDDNGAEWLYAVQPAGRADEGKLFVSAMISSTDLLALSTRQLRVQLAALAVITLLAAVAAWLFGDRILARPLSRVLRRIDALRHDESPLDSPGAQTRVKELGEIDERFHDMARSLVERAVLRDAALRELAGQKNLFESVLESMAEGVLVFDNSGRFLHINAAARRIMPGLADMSRDGAAHAVASEWGLFEIDGTTPLASQPQPPAQLLAACSDDSFRYLVRGRMSGGPERIVQGHTRHLQSPQGGGDGSVVVFADITAEYHAQQAVLQMNETLERRVDERTRELALSNRELESFSYSVSHDLRAPLQVIDGFGKSLLTRHSSSLDDQGRHYLLRIRENTRQMGELIDDLLSLARVTRTELRMEPVNLAPKAAQVVERLRQRFPARDVQVGIEETIPCTGDARLLGVVLENLIENAWKYTARAPQAQIRIGRKTLPDGETSIYVADNGAGFDMALAGKLFSPFQRLHAATDFEGTGIGLATVQRVVTRHGGRVWAESRPGEGATFLFTLQTGAIDETQPNPPG